ncbi:carboxyl transferase domain-containing protein [Lentzea sp.]|uniref:carboxyl transferase domain-containing protein n=1 Tax=Lentzea sp. TaxID=56099 RepID=UPI002CFFB509|nr:carboxyl transferase domain-containing protein [Lentzea sp.]HUQ60878.1 carboxyl transferase domain-containing protein [Lentzea sp.]
MRPPSHTKRSLRRIAVLLVANRGEVAVRVLRAAADLGIRTVAVYAEDDASSLHVTLADHAVALRGDSPYLDVAQILDAASGCQAVHPGWGFLSENAEFARACSERGLAFVGPSADVLELLGDKRRARELASSLGIPVLEAAPGEFPVMVKAVAGGGGKGMRAVFAPEDLDSAVEACRAEALAAFGVGDVYFERLMPSARHIEVQLVGTTVIGDRDCSLQLRHQKVVEIAPAPLLEPSMRESLHEAAVAIASAAGYTGVGTVEFLVSGDSFAFLEVNPRLQVEHTVTEMVSGVDLVRTQLLLTWGGEVDYTPLSRGSAVQVRVNQTSGGVLSSFGLPAGPGVRVDTHGYVGYRVGTRYDGLLAKLVVHGEDLDVAVNRARRALGEFRIEGVSTNLEFLRSLLSDDIVGATTDFIVEEPASGMRAPLAGTVVAVSSDSVVLEAMKMQHVVRVSGEVLVSVGDTVAEGQLLASGGGESTEDVAEVDLSFVRPDLAEVLARHDFARPEAAAKRHARGGRTARENIEDLCSSFVEYGGLAIAAQRQRRSVAELIERTPADGLVAGIGIVNGQRVVAMSYDYAVLAGTQGMRNHQKKDRLFALAQQENLPVVLFAEGGGGRPGDTDHSMVSGLDCGSFHAFARLSGQVPLVGVVAGRCFAGNAVLLGTCDVIIAVEGANIGMGGPAMIEGGGLGVFRPEDVGPLDVQVPNGVVDIVVGSEEEAVAVARQYLSYFQAPAGVPRASAQPSPAPPGGPLDSIVPDSTDNSWPSGSGTADTGPSADGQTDAQTGGGQTGRHTTGGHTGSGHTADGRPWACADQRLLRHAVPENRLRAYDIRHVITTLADTGSVLELRAGFGKGIVTALIRVEGRAIALIANDPRVLGGAIDADAADKCARFLQLADAFDIPVVSLCDTPGFMVGPDAERTATVRHLTRMVVTGANITVPFGLVVLRKAYGLGAQAMAAGSLKVPRFAISWPTGEFGPMGLEGAIKLGFKKELEAIGDPQERKQRYDQMVAMAYEHGKALNVASVFEIDDVIDPADTRRWIATALAPTTSRVHGKKRPFIDTW